MAKTDLVIVCLVIILLLVFSIISDVKCDDEELFFDGFSASSSNMSLSGCTSIEANGLLHLTNRTRGRLMAAAGGYKPRLEGNAFYSTPIKLKNSTTGKAFSFSTAFAFSIFDWYDNTPTMSCFAFTVSPSKALPSQHLMSLIDPRQTVEVVFDSKYAKKDMNFFYVFFNGEPYRVDIDLNRLLNNVHFIHTKTFYGGLIQAWVDYHSSNNQLEIRLSPNSSKPILPILSWHNVVDPRLNETMMYVGFSASTTKTLDLQPQYIAGWSFKVNGGEATSLDLETLPSLLPVLIYRQSRLDQSYGLVRIFLFVIVPIIILVMLYAKRIDDRYLELERQYFKNL